MEEAPPKSSEYARNQKRWFETIANYEPNAQFKNIFAELAPNGWKLDKQSIWFVASPPSVRLMEQGWKIHISTQTTHAADVLRISLSRLFDRMVYFKFAADMWIAGEMNSKLWPREASGKFITVYPSNTPDFLSLANELTDLLRDYDGPYILSDRRWPNSRCVFYRYGAFKDHSEVTSDGLRRQLISQQDGTLATDLRQPYFYLPPGIIDPHGGELIKSNVNTQRASTVYALKGGRYKIEAALNFSNRGGVYRATDEADNRTVIVKEARPLIEVGRARSNAVQVLKDEYELLIKLNDTGYFAKPTDFFRVWEHSYLVEDYVRGDTLAEYILAHHPIYNHDSVNALSINHYLKRMTSVWLKIARAIQCAHERDIILGDLSINNVMVSREDDAITIIDLEGAHTGNSPSVGLFTPGFIRRSSWETGLSDQDTDLYGLGAIMFASLVIANAHVDYYPNARHTFLSELRLDLDLPEELVNLIELLHNEDNLSITSIEEVISMLECLREGLEKNVAFQPRLALSVESRFPPDHKSDLYCRTLATTDGIIDYLGGVADLSRRDRLFPGDMLIFATNPLSIAYGACGILHCLQLVKGQIASDFVDWVLNIPVDNDDYPPGLYLGKSGIAWVMDEIGHPEYARILLREASAHRLLWNTADVLHGASGFGLASLRFWHKHNDGTALDNAVKVGDWLTRNAIRGPDGVRWASEDGTINLGYAQGGSGIALFLLYLSLTTGDVSYRCLGRSALDFEIKHAAWNGSRFLGFPEEPGLGPSPYWAAGTAGVLTTMLRYLATSPDEVLKNYVGEYEGDVGHKYAKFPQLFRGLAGMGNTLLDLWYFSHDDKYVRQAWQIAEGVLLHSISRPEGITFPGTRALRESADFATGAAGVALFLHRLMVVDCQDSTPTGLDNFNFTLDQFYFTPAPEG
jgi:serine/threonine protein kinase